MTKLPTLRQKLIPLAKQFPLEVSGWRHVDKRYGAKWKNLFKEPYVELSDLSGFPTFSVLQQIENVGLVTRQSEALQKIVDDIYKDSRSGFANDEFRNSIESLRHKDVSFIGGAFYTYNDPDHYNLSRDIHGFTVVFKNKAMLVFSIHVGVDARCGFTEPCVIQLEKDNVYADDNKCYYIVDECLSNLLYPYLEFTLPPEEENGSSTYYTDTWEMIHAGGEWNAKTKQWQIKGSVAEFGLT